MRRWVRLGLIVLAVGVVVILSGWLLVPRLRPYTFHGTILQSPEPALDFTLTSHTGHQVSLHDFRGKLVILYFGYTFCPDVCPTTLAQVNQALEILGEEKASQIQFIMISVDPERDTPERLAQYVPRFNPDFIGLTGTPEEIAAVATPYGVYYEKHASTSAAGYLVDHTATLIVLDRQGHVKLLLPFGTTPEDMASDLAYMLR